MAKGLTYSSVCPITLRKVELDKAFLMVISHSPHVSVYVENPSSGVLSFASRRFEQQRYCGSKRGEPRLKACLDFRDTPADKFKYRTPPLAWMDVLDVLDKYAKLFQIMAALAAVAVYKPAMFPTAPNYLLRHILPKSTKKKDSPPNIITDMTTLVFSDQPEIHSRGFIQQHPNGSIMVLLPQSVGIHSLTFLPPSHVTSLNEFKHVMGGSKDQMTVPLRPEDEIEMFSMAGTNYIEL